MMVTAASVKSRLGLDTGHAWLVGLLSYAGGNLPMIAMLPIILVLVPRM